MLKLPTAYMVPPHRTIWRICSRHRTVRMVTVTPLIVLVPGVIIGGPRHGIPIAPAQLPR